MKEFEGLRLTEKGMEISGTFEENLEEYLKSIKKYEPDIDAEKVKNEIKEHYTGSKGSLK